MNREAGEFYADPAQTLDFCRIVQVGSNHQVFIVHEALIRRRDMKRFWCRNSKGDRAQKDRARIPGRPVDRAVIQTHGKRFYSRIKER